MEKKLPESLQKLIKKVEEAFPEDPRMVQLFINCFTNTLDTTVKRLEDGTTYIITGDIPAMWLGTVWRRSGLISWRRERIRKLRTCWWGLFGSSSFM